MNFLLVPLGRSEQLGVIPPGNIAPTAPGLKVRNGLSVTGKIILAVGDVTVKVLPPVLGIMLRGGCLSVLCLSGMSHTPTGAAGGLVAGLLGRVMCCCCC